MRSGNERKSVASICLVAESEVVFPHEPDHLIARKHGGTTVSENLALACFDCNRFKRTDIASVDLVTGEVVCLFNPRTQSWSDHFQLEGGRIVSLTATARVTEQLVRLNLPVRVEIRQRLANLGKYLLLGNHP